MSIPPTTPESPVDLAVVGAVLAEIEELLDRLSGAQLRCEPGADPTGVVEAAGAVATRTAELKLRVAATAAATGAHQEEAATDPASWLARLTGTTRAAMAGGLRLAEVLSTRYPSVQQAFAHGLIDQAQVGVIVRAAEKAPAEAEPAQVDAAVADLVERAVQERLDPGRLRRIARRMLARIDRSLADRHQATLLHDEERLAESQASFRLFWHGDGRVTGTFEIPELHASLLTTVLEHLSAPRRLSRNASDQSVVDETAGGLGHHDLLGRAFCELLEHLPTDGWSNHGRVGATVMVHVDQQHLLDGLGAAGLDTGIEITAGQARRLACNAGLIPAVLGSDSVPLDLGRTTRLHTSQQRAALSAIHDTCAAEGCRRPFAWTEIHHPVPWSHGGETDLDNALPLCGWHHRKAHDTAFRTTLLPTGELRYRRKRRRLPDPAASNRAVADSWPAHRPDPPPLPATAA